MAVDLTGRRIIVAGAATGIGEAAVDYFVSSGARVAAMDIKATEKSEGDSLRHFVADIRDRAQVSQAFDQACAFMGGLDVLCHPAGLNGRGIAEELTAEQMLHMFEVNVMGTFHTNQEAWRHMRDHGGSIINFTSAASIRGQKNEAHYAASKGAVAGWTRAVAMDWGKYNIRVNAVAPMAHTPMVDVARDFVPEAQRAAFDDRLKSLGYLPGGLRPGTAIAPLLGFLASEESDYITGQTFSVDGGVMMLGS
ncbi:hypothetical protein ASE00_13630 [Sphingomonas sp. Root710]|uniref:SDR family NAD(P)-dependent oxidoreductase n=1 Tax=Sphingomonas sp. Root710 TaxID=1736594 RepID=UPI0006F9D9EB|nr:SDR family oxidoreductase [Sphingomonas sp. Root710]KRB83023.1 hypothetical protein ASE00_13630 [Sphingomonas sp. Root710]